MNRLVKALLMGILTGLVGTLLGLTPYGANFERNVGLPWLFNIRGTLPSPDKVVIVAINNRTGEQINLPSLPRDWPRSIHAKLVDNLVQRGAEVIVFDVHFHKPESQKDDQQFVNSVKQSDRVVLVEQVDGKRQPLLNAQGKIVGTVWAEKLLQPFAELTRVAKGLGTFTLPKTDAAVNGFWVFKESMSDAATIPAVALHLYSIATRPMISEPSIQLPLRYENNELESSKDANQADLLSRTMREFRTQYFNANPLVNKPSIESWVDKKPALLRMYQGSSYRYINFYGPPGTIQTIPYHAVIKGEDPNVPEALMDFTGKVVFVGYSDLFDPGQPDRFYTNFTSSDGVDLSGVEIAATAFANLLNDQSLSLPSGYQAPGLLFGFGFIVGLIAYLFPAIFGITLVILLSGLYVFAAQFFFNREALWLPLATPVLVEMPMAIFLGLVGHYFFERRRSQHISEALSYYLPDSAAKQLTQKSASHDSFNKVVYSTCLATDMAGFSSIAEKLSPGELALMLNDYFDTLAASLNKHSVDVTEFRADAIMCAWTAEESNIPIRKKPILAALEAVDAMQEFRKRYELFNTGLRIGLEAGTIYVGHAGGGGHFVFSIVGDCANTASRIEGLNKQIGTQILATETVIEGLDGLLVRYIGDFLFVNKSDPSSIYEILATQANSSSDQVLLCERYAEALHCFQQGQWEEATVFLEAILQLYPEDGPSKFLLNRSVQYLKGVLTPDEYSIIRMDVK